MTKRLDMLDTLMELEGQLRETQEALSSGESAKAWALLMDSAYLLAKAKGEWVTLNLPAQK